MNFILIILFSVIILYIALVYKVYVLFNKNIKLSIFSAMVVPLLIYDLNFKSAKELKVPSLKIILDSFIDFDIFAHILCQVLTKEAQGKKVEIKIRIRLLNLSTEEKLEYTEQMRTAKIL
jgi:hypothetical protein